MNTRSVIIELPDFSACLDEIPNARNAYNLEASYMPTGGKTEKQLSVIPVKHRLAVSGDPYDIKEFLDHVWKKYP